MREKHSQLFFLIRCADLNVSCLGLAGRRQLNGYKVEKQRLGCHVVENLLFVFVLLYIMSSAALKKGQI